MEEALHPDDAVMLFIR